MEAIEGEYMQIAVLNKPFKTTNWEEGGIIHWKEMELLRVKKRQGPSHLWECKKWDRSTDTWRDNLLVVSTSHLEFTNIEWQKIR
jgi:hypothetical protein